MTPHKTAAAAGSPEIDQPTGRALVVEFHMSRQKETKSIFAAADLEMNVREKSHQSITRLLLYRQVMVKQLTLAESCNVKIIAGVKQHNQETIRLSFFNHKTPGGRNIQH